VKTCIHCVVSGRVQGVFFRASTRDVALRLGLTGWVRNLPDGRVEVIASGPPNEVEQLRRWLERGPPRAMVSDVATTSATDEGWTTFEVC
jgi:acylphosphatase